MHHHWTQAGRRDLLVWDRGGVHVTTGVRDPAASFALPATADDADERRQANRAIGARRMAEDPITLTLAQAIEEFLDWQALDRGRSPNTVRAYGIDLAGFRAFAGAVGIEQLAGVDRDLLREFQVTMARGRRGGGRPLSPQTRHRRLVALRSFLRFCAREDWTPGDLGVAIDLPKLPRRLPKPLQADELVRVTAQPSADLDEAQLRDRALVAFLI